MRLKNRTGIGPAAVFVSACLLVLYKPHLTQASPFYLSPTGSDTVGNGSRQSPWKTIAFAAARVADEGAEIVLLDGVYEGAQSMGRQFRRPCVVRAENPYRARLRPEAGQNRVFTCYNAANVTVRGLEMAGGGGTRGEYLVHVGTANAHHITFEDCIIHDCYNNDLIKINDGAHHIVFRNCVVYNQTDHGGDQHFDINTVTDIAVEDSIFFNDYAGSGRPVGNQSQGFVVIKNSGSTPNVTRRIALRRNIFLNWQGKPDQAFILLGEDGKPFYEAQEVMIENNLFLHNSPIRLWSTLLYKGGLKDITFRANTVVGHPAIRWTGGYAVACLRIGKNPPIGDLTFVNNIWSDASGQMPQFTMSDPKHFAPGSKQVLANNLYWNGGKPIPTEKPDVLTPAGDAKKIVTDPRLGNPNEGVTLPRWDAAKGRFLSGQATIRGEFERLVRRYAALGEGSAAIDAADSTNMPADDILGTKRDRRPDVGCLESVSVSQQNR